MSVSSKQLFIQWRPKVATAALLSLLPGLGMAQRSEEPFRPKERTETVHIKGELPKDLPEDPNDLPKPNPNTNPGNTNPHSVVTPENPVNSTVKPPVVAETPKDDRPAFLGVHYEVSRVDVFGSYVTDVEPNTPAALVGIRTGDVITKADGKPLVELEDLVRIISTKKVGDKVALTVYREGKVFTVSPVLAVRTHDLVTYQYGSSDGMVPLPNGNMIWIDDPYSRGRPFLGLTFRREEKIVSLDNGDVVKVPASNDMIVTDIAPGSTAKELGLMKGDKLISFNGRQVNDFDVIPMAMQQLEIGDEIRISVLRNGKTIHQVGKLRGRPAMDGSVGLKEEAAPTPDPLEMYWEMVDKSHESGRRPATVSQAAVNPDEVTVLRSKSGYQFPAASTLALPDFKLMPAGLNGEYMVQFTLPSRGNTLIYVIDAEGNFVYSETLMSYGGTYRKTFNLPKDQLGDYFVQIAHAGKSFTSKITLH